MARAWTAPSPFGKAAYPVGLDAAHRPLPGTADGAQHPRAAVRRPAVRAGHVERVEIVYDETLGVEGRAGDYERRMRR
jgi:hypothetical protein